MPEDLKALNRRFNEQALEQDNVDLIVEELLAEDFVEHILMPGQAPGRQGVKDVIHMFRSAFSDVRVEYLVEVAEGDVIASVSRITATHQGEFMGVPPTGNQVSLLFGDVGRVRDGKFVEHWGFLDQDALMQQLGATPGGP